MTKHLRTTISALMMSGMFIVNSFAAGGDVSTQGNNLLQMIFAVYRRFLLPIFLCGAVLSISVFAFSFIFSASDSIKSADRKISEAKDRMVKVLVATAFATLIPAFVVVGRSIISDSSLKPWDPNNDSGNHIIQPAGEGDDGWTLFEGGEDNTGGEGS